MNRLLQGACAIGASSAILVGHHEFTHSIPFMYDRMARSVVTIDSIASKRSALDVRERIPVRNGVGTGFVIKTPRKMPYTLIATNYHVIEDAEHVVVRFYKNDKEVEASVIDADPFNDLAFLAVPNEPVEGLRLCGRAPVVGEDVLAIGSPYGMETSVSSGIVSGLHRALPDSVYKDMIQTDAPIAPGNSGGPLIARGDGCVLGMNTATIASGGSIGFAVPASAIKEHLQE